MRQFAKVLVVLGTLALVLAAFPTLASVDVPALDSVSMPVATSASGLDSLLPLGSLPARHWWGGGWGGYGWGGWPWFSGWWWPLWPTWPSW